MAPSTFSRRRCRGSGSHWLLRSAAAATAITFVSAVNAQESSATPSLVSLAPAATVVSADSVAGVPLFGFETVQLTEEVLQRIHDTAGASEYADLFAFDSSIAGGAAGASETKQSKRSGTCKVFPGDVLWPTNTVWDLLDVLLGRDALIPTIPLAAPCYNSFGVYNAANCAEVQSTWSSPDSHMEDPTSIMWPLYEGHTCMPTDNPNNTCTLGGYPSYAVNATQVSQIQLAVNFARNTNIRLVIKNTGHDFNGKSSGAGAISIWTHNLKDISFISNYNGVGYSGKAMKASAGVQVEQLYQAARDNNVIVIAGVCETVGAMGGYIAGGGHSPLSSIYGLAADQILALEVVTADGRFVTATPGHNSDLYWALSGGGGSTYGVVTSIIIKVYPDMPITTSSFTFSSSDTVSVDTFWAGFRSFLENFPRFTDAGAFSTFYVFPSSTTYTFSMTPFFAPNHTIYEFNALAKPWFDRLTELGIAFTPNTTYYTGFYNAWRNSYGLDTVGLIGLRTGSRLFQRSSWEDPAKFNATFDAIRNVTDAGHVLGGFKLAPRSQPGINNSVNSAWRNSLVHMVTSVLTADDASVEEIKAAADDLTYNLLEQWRVVAPNSEGAGSYLGEADIMEPDWQAAFFGSAYPRLYELKQKWDPKSVFYATRAVGSEDWEVRDGEEGVQTQNGKLCRV